MKNKIASPFRYPGAKTRLLDGIITVLEKQSKDVDVFIDVFCGGGSVALSYLQKNNQIKKIILNDKDKAVYSFWKCLTDKDMSKELSERLKNTKPTIDVHIFLQAQLESNNLIDSGYAAIVLNRISFSGILTSGPIGGYKQTSKWDVGCRFNAKKLHEQILQLHSFLHGRMEAYNEDFEIILNRYGGNTKNLIYCDAPYYEKGNQLYRCKMFQDDHVRLANCIKASKAPYVLSYDNHNEIKKLYNDFAVIEELAARYSIRDRKENWTDNKEILIYNKE